MDPGDNILYNVEPRSVRRYIYEIGSNHMPGTFWYHPHRHGSTALQTAQGASGLIIIDPPESYNIPQTVLDMPDVEMVLHHPYLLDLAGAAETSEDLVTNWADNNFEVTNATTDVDDLILVNMQMSPKITMDIGKWYRWRMLMSSVKISLGGLSERALIISR
jgi:FtsP/CotA-like multicopper oxidase with cupredoxin domain